MRHKFYSKQPSQQVQTTLQSCFISSIGCLFSHESLVTVPLKSLPLNHSFSRLGNCKSCSGNFPDSLLLSAMKWTRLIRFPNSEGT